MKYKISEIVNMLKSGNKSYLLSIDILDNDGNIDDNTSYPIWVLLDTEYGNYDDLKEDLEQRDGVRKEKDGSTLHDHGEGVYWRIYPDKTYIWNYIKEEDGVPYEHVWIANDKLLAIAKKFYEIKATFVKDRGYTGVTDELYEV